MTQRQARILVAAAALLAAGCSLFLCWSQFGLQPHISDEVAYVFQGRLLAAGRLALEPPPVPEMFAFGHILITKERWCSIYPPGWPALLAIGWLAGAPWLINPLLLAASVVALFLLAQRLYDARTALTAALLLVASPFVLEMHAGFLSHPVLLCASLWTGVLLMDALRNDGPRRWFAAGLCAGACILVRPFTAVALLGPLAVWLFSREAARRRIPILLAGALPFLLVLLVYNHFVFGSAFTAGYRLDPEWREPAFSPAFFAQNFTWYIREINARLWDWPFPNLLFLVPLLWPGRARKADLLLAACAISLLLLYSFYYYRDIVLGGPRFVFESMGICAILAARALSIFAEGLSRRVRSVRPAVWLTSFAALALASLAVRLPQQWMYHSQNYHRQSHELVRMVRNLNLGEDALVLVGGDRYAIGAFYFDNALLPEGGRRLYVRDPGRPGVSPGPYARHATWNLTVELKPLPGSPNSYTDRWTLRGLRIERIRSAP